MFAFKPLGFLLFFKIKTLRTRGTKPRPYPRDFGSSRECLYGFTHQKIPISPSQSCPIFGKKIPMKNEISTPELLQEPRPQIPKLLGCSVGYPKGINPGRNFLPQGLFLLSTKKIKIFIQQKEPREGSVGVVQTWWWSPQIGPKEKAKQKKSNFRVKKSLIY